MMSVFFIVVLLFGVIFAIGYILGRNSGPMTESASAHKIERPLMVPSPARDSSPPPPTLAESTPQTPPPETPKAAEPKKAESKPEPKKTESAKVETAKVEPAKPQPPKPEQAKKADAPAPLKPGPLKPAPAPPPAQSATGTYLQLAATTKAEAEILADVLRKKGFKSITSQVPDKELYRVLVGPIAEGSANKTKADLQAAGFPGDKAIKKTF